MDNELKVPNHIAIILDGNGRWAKKRNMPRGYGHIVGCDNLEKMCDAKQLDEICAQYEKAEKEAKKSKK